MATLTNTRAGLSAGVMTLPGRYYSDPAVFSAEMERIHHAMWLCAGREEQITEPGQLLRPPDRQRQRRHPARAGRHAAGVPQRLPAPRHACCATASKASCPAGSSARTTPGPTASTAASWARRTWRRCEGFRDTDYPLHSVAVDTWDGHIFINLAQKPLPFPSTSPTCRRSSRPWGMAGLRLVERQGLPPAGELEAHHPELLGVPALPDRRTRC